MAKYRVHFTDNYGGCTIECDTWQEFQKAIRRANEDPYVEDIWTEEFDEEEGWQA